MNPPGPVPTGVIDNLDALVGEAFRAKNNPAPAAAAEPEEKPEEKPPEAKKDVKEIPDFDPDAPKPEVKAVEKDEPTPKTAKEWKEFKAKYKAETEKAVKEAEERVRKQMAEQAPLVSNEELESLKAKLVEYDTALKVTAVERHPQFQKYFEERNKNLIETAKEVAGEKVANLMQLPPGPHRDALMNEAVAELSPIQQMQFGAVLVQKTTLDRERAGELSRASQSYQAMQAQRAQQEHAAKEQAKAELETVLKDWSDPDRGSPLLKPGSPHAEKIQAQARAIYAGQLDNRNMAKASIWAAKGPVLASELKGALTRIAELEAQVSSLSAAKPSIDGSSGPASNSDLPSNAGWLDAVMAQMAKA
jgi:major membrane immunogen (membrane-anchored lipoprotein)